MRLISCHIFGFGSFCDQKIEFNENLTAILEQNGFGKSTLAAFVKAILFGLETARRDDTALSSERLKYTPWSASSFGGSISFECEKGQFIAIRKFAPLSKTADSFELIDAKSGKPSDAFSDRLGNELFGIDKEGFNRSTFLSNELNLTALPSSLRHKIGSEDNLEDISGFEPAKQKLEGAIKKLNEKNGEIFKTNKKIAENKVEIEKYRVSLEEYLRLKGEIEKTKNEISVLEEKDKALEEKITAANTYESNRIKLQNYNKLVTEIKNIQSEILKLEEAYGDKLPEIKVVSELEAKIEKYLNKSVILEHSVSKLNELKNIEEDFSGKDISKEQILSLDNEIVKIDTHCALIKEKETQIKEKKEKLLTLATLEPLPNEANDMESKKGEIVLKILSAFGVLIGICVCFANLYIGVAVAAVALIILILSVFYSVFSKKLSSQKPVGADYDRMLEAKNLKKEIEQAEQKIKEENDTLRVSLKASWEMMDEFSARKENLRETFDEFKNRYNRYQNEVIPLKDEISKAKCEIKALENEIKAVFSSFNKNVEPSYFEAELKNLHNDIKSYNEKTELLKALSIEREKQFSEEKIDKITLSENELNIENVIGEKRQNALELNSLREKNAELVRNASILKDSQEEINLLENENSDLSEQILALTEKKEILTKTLEFLNSAKDKLTSKYASKVTSGFEKYSKIFFKETEGNIRLDQNLEISVIKEGIARYPQSFSQGQQSVMDVCLKFALVNAMFEKEKPFVILDDPFVNLDKENLDSALRLIKTVSNEMQIIYLTCHNSRML